MIFDAHMDILNDVMVRRLRGETAVLRRRHLDRLRRGGVEGGTFALWVDPPSDPVLRTRQMMDCARAELAESEEFCVVCSNQELLNAKKEGKIYILPAAEGLAAIGTDEGKLSMYYEFGVRQAMLTWNEENALATGAATGKDTGLTAAGRRVVKRLGDMGMLLDVSHLNEGGFWDVMKLSKGPVIASHSNAKALCDVPRNLTDAQLRAIRDSGGVVGVNVYHDFIDQNPAGKTVEGLARHACHMVEVMGVAHVGCGFDFCEFLASAKEDDPVTSGLKDCGEIGNFFACLMAMGMTTGEIEQIASGNFLRMIRLGIR